MPAIDLARLKKQTAQLTDLFNRPEDFVRALHDMLDFYVNRSRREADTVAPSSALDSYHTPPVILKAIETEIGPLAVSDPNATIELADRLWDEDWLETRLLAASLLGRIPPQEEQLLARLTAWAGQVREPSVRATLLTTSLARLQREMPERFLALVSEWLNPERQRLWPHGIQALLPLIRDQNYHNLPPIFDMLESIVEAAPASIQNDLVDLFGALHAASPTETTHFLQQVIANSNTPMTAITFRRILPSLPAELADAIRDLVRGIQAQ